MRHDDSRVRIRSTFRLAHFPHSRMGGPDCDSPYPLDADPARHVHGESVMKFLAFVLWTYIILFVLGGVCKAAQAIFADSLLPLRWLWAQWNDVPLPKAPSRGWIAIGLIFVIACCVQSLI